MSGDHETGQGRELAAGPLVSIVTPTFRQGPFIEQTIRSIRAQTYGRIEHIVVDGGSDDGTPAILRRYEGEYDLRWVSEPDRGMYDAINKGMAMARGDIVAYLNSDDLYFPWTVSTAVEGLAASPERGLVFGDALWADDASPAQRILFQPPYRQSYLMSIGSFAQPATFWRRGIIEEVGGFNPGLNFTGDLDFFIRAAGRFGAFRVDEVLAIMRWHSGMKTVTGAREIVAENAVVRRRHAGGRPMGAAVVARERGRAWIWRRRLAVGLARQAGLEPGARTRWRNYLEAADLRVSWPNLMLSMIPSIGVRFSRAAMSSGVDWLRAGTGETSQENAVPL